MSQKNEYEETLDLRDKLLEAEAQRLSGAKTFTLDEVESKLEDIINGKACIEVSD
ncbi:MAG: hypothetical protein NC203_08020 [Firmicutes bacterium]|nr:hypothetical protein [[Eubacterium] siraeum]MCM1488296.1 hypothetical protein [Bacillota bacterium]